MNYGLFRDINNLSGNGAWDAVMKFSAQYLIFLAAAVVALLCLDRLRRRRLTPIVATAAGLALTYLLGRLGGALYSERRPFQAHSVHQLITHASGQSFPSDHATAAFGLALVAFAFLSRPWGVVLFLLALLIGFARVYVGVHYPGDIGGGLLAAVVGVGIVALAGHRTAGRRRLP
ncbi:MAG TPA: phosphatase PAP2 family protein [Mycobacteriales bacterium]